MKIQDNINDITNINNSISNNKKLEGKTLKNNILEQLKKYIAKNKLYISFAIISIGNDEASKIYIKQKIKMAEEIGIKCNVLELDENITTDKVVEEIKLLNNNINVNGIIVQLPIPEHLDKIKILNTIDSLKDIDGLTNINLGKLVNNEKGLFPATASGIIKLLEHYNINVSGKDILIINRSTLVGKPLSLMLLDKDATVTISHSKTINLNKKLKDYDIIISAVGKKDLIKKEDVRKDTILIDVGVNRIDGKIYGDIEEDLKKRNISSPTIGGVGPLTIAMLATNIVEAYKLQNNIE